MTDTIDVAALVERLTNLVGTQIEDDLEYIQAADAAMTDAVNALVLQADELAALNDGRRVIMPHTVEHAENFYTVSVAALKSFGRDPEASLATMREALEWYDVQVRNCRKLGNDGHEARAALDRDGGDCARRALGGSK